MSYVDFDYFTALYPDIDEAVFNRLLFGAERKIDNQTTGIDGVKKLKEYFPTGDDAEIVKRCVCELINTMNNIDIMERQSLSTEGTISSVSSGSESISYKTTDSRYTLALTDRAERENLYNDVIREYLNGCADSNGVQLLYMGEYV